MDEIPVTRRNLIIASGATLALGACSAGGGEKQSGSATDRGPRGTDPSYGDNPNVGFPKEPQPFAPKFITLVRITSAGAWEISANHASFSITETDYNARKQLAAKIFGRFKDDKSAKPISRFAELKDATNEYKIVPRKNDGGTRSDGPAPYDRLDFDGFNFGGQHEIYIWFDTPKVTLVSSKDGKPQLISMTRQRTDGSSTNLNKSFYAENFEPQVSVAPIAKPDGPVMVVRNYFRDENANAIKDGPGLAYSMNIFFNVKSKVGKDMVMILDPDTGNGNGLEPLQ